MTTNFDEIIDRSNTNAAAVEGFQDYLFDADVEITLNHAPEDLVSMWVADMSFASAPAAIAAIQKRLAHPVFGYTMNFDNAYYDAFVQWTQQQYGWQFAREALLISSGVIPALFDLVDQLCGVNETALTLTPAYGYFKHAVTHHHRELRTSPLKVADGHYTIDFEDLQRQTADPAVRVLFLCHPHNPTGRSWTDAELRQIGEICFENNVIIVSDEIHCDLLRVGKQHTPLAKLFPDSDQIITCMAPSKTFNLAGMMTANIIIPNPELRALWQARSHPFVSPLGLAAAQGAYENGHDWLQALRAYLDKNFNVLAATLKQELPQAVFQIPDATYLAWVDLSAYLPADLNLTKFFLEEAGVIMEGGEMFVADGGTRVRLNVACPTSTLLEGLRRIVAAVNAYKTSV